MKLLALELRAFGRFTDAKLDFSEGAFHVIHGPNEAGKSTAMRALTDLLFGIPHRTSDDFLHEAKRLRIGGEVLSADGARLAFLRRKGNARTLLDPTGQDLDDAALAPFLGTATRETFETIFRLDHPGLVAGGQDLLEGRGNLAQSLFQAAAGITGLRRVLSALEAEAGELFKPNASKPRLNRALADYDFARRLSRDAALRPAEWSATVDQRDHLAREVKELRVKLESDRQQLRRLERQHAAHPHAKRRDALIQERLALGEVTLLPPDAAQQREELEKSQRRLQPIQEEAEAHLARLEAQRAALQTAPDLLAQAPAISDLGQRLREFRAAIAELPDFSRPERDAERGLAELRRLDDEISLRITQLLPTPTASTTSIIPTTCATPTAPPAPAAPSASITPPLHHSTTPTPPTAADLERLALPTSETVDRFEQEFASLSREKFQHLREIDQVTAEVETSRAQARAIQLGGAVPTEADLERARARRERGWRLLLEKWSGKSTLDFIEAAAYCGHRGQQTLEAAYADAVREADLISDRLRREADRVAALANFLADADRGVARLAALNQQIATLETRAAELRHEWLSAWAGAGLTPSTPAEMQPWLRRHADLLRLASARREKARAISEETARFRSFAEAFSRETQALTHAVAPDLATLPPDRAVETLQARLAQAQQDAARRQHVDEQIERERKTASKAKRELETTRLELEALLAQARCPTREALLEAEARSQQARRLDAEIAIETRALAGHAAAPVHPVHPVQTVQTVQTDSATPSLHHSTTPTLQHSNTPTTPATPPSLDLFAAQIASLDRDSLEVEIAQLSQSTHAADLALAEKQRLLGEAEAHVKAMDGGPASAVAAEDAQAYLAEARDAAEDYIRLHLAAALLRRQIEHYRRENQDPVLHRASELFSALTLGSFSGITTDFRETDDPVLLGLRPTRDGAGLQGQPRDRGIDSVGRSVGSVEAGGNRSVDSVEAGGNRSVDSVGAGGNRSVGSVQAGGNSRDCGTDSVEVSGMSEGARDQLYLALRIATLERQMQLSDPLPFVVDDVLVSFDDARARAALSVLAELCARTQVLFFTHHPHLVELARQAVPDSLRREHHL